MVERLEMVIVVDKNLDIIFSREWALVVTVLIIASKRR